MSTFGAPKNVQNAFFLEPLEPRLLLDGAAGLPDDLLVLEAGAAPGPPLWVPQGPSPVTGGQVEGITNSPVTGAIHAVAPHPTDVNTLYIGAVNGGVWKTTNATAGSPTWTPLTDEESSLSISTLEFDPTDVTHETLIAGIGRYSSFGWRGGAREGLLRTDDGGGTWTELDGGGTLDGTNISGVAARGSVIVVAVDNTASGGGVYRSDNTGATFPIISGALGTDLPAGDVTDLVGDPGDPARLYAALVNGAGQGVYTSDDTGQTWAPINGPAMDTVMDGTTNNIEMAVHDHAGINAVYVAVMNDGQMAGMFRSPDYGATWAVMDIPLTDEDGTWIGIQPRVHPGSQGRKHFSMVADSVDPDIVYVGGDRQPQSDGDTGGWPNSIGAEDYTGRLFRGDASQPHGSQWIALTHDPSTDNTSAPHADSRDMAFDASGDIIEVDDGGVYRRDRPLLNNGDWYSLNGNLMVSELHSVKWDSVTGTIRAGTQDIGTPEQVTPGGLVWREVSKGDGGKVGVDDSGEESLRYSSYYELGSFVRKSYDSDNDETGSTDIDLTISGSSGNSLSENYDSTVQFYQPFELNVINPARMIIGTDYLYESSNRGDDLTALGGLTDLTSDGMDNDNDGDVDDDDEFMPINPVGTVTAMAYGGVQAAVNNANVLYVGNDSGNVLVRTAGGGLPAVTAAPFPGGVPRDIVLDPADWARAYVLTDDELWVTPDAGATTWTNLTGALSDVDLHSIVYVETGIADGVIVGGRNGVFGMLPAASPAGQWLELDSSLPNALVFDLDYDATDNVLLAGTIGRGAWTIPTFRETMLDVLLGSIEGRLWEDINGDGIQNFGELGLVGETVELYDAGSVFVTSTVTDEFGEYIFDALIPDDYYVEFVKPFEFAITPKDQGVVDTIDSDANRQGGRTDVITVLLGENVTDIDGGMFGPDRFEQNDTHPTAARLGVLPGVHINDLTISVPGESDWFEVELLRDELTGFDVEISFTHAFGDLDLAVFESDGLTLVGASTTASDNESVSTGPLTAGTYYVQIIGDGAAVNVYNISMEPSAGSVTTVYYVNDDSLVDGVYTLAVGDDLNDGLTALTPKATVQSVLADYILSTTDRVVVDTGTYASGGTVTITVDDEGAVYAGSADGSVFAYGGTRFEMVDSDFNLFYDLTIGGTNSGTGFYAHSNAVDDSTNNEFRFNKLPGSSVGIRIDDGEADLIRDNIVTGSGADGIKINDGLSVEIRDNSISGRTDAIEAYTDDTSIHDNVLSGASRGIRISGPLANIFDNDITGVTTGISTSAVTANIYGNEIHHSGDGVWSNVGGAYVYGNEIHSNSTGIYGYGTFGGTDWGSDQVNEIHDNTRGVFADNNSTVRFNRIFLNAVGVHVDDAADVHHNVIYRNTDKGLLVDNGNVVTIVNNTIYTPSGDGVHVRNFSKNVELRNNILWTEDGYDLHVTTDSQVGFASDYNNFYSTNLGKLVWWQKDFTDIFDWQVEADFDNHSIGRTVPAPGLDNPQFVNLGANDYHLTAVTSTSIDAGDPLDIFPLEPAPRGARINLGAYGNTAEAAISRSAYISLDSPNYYTDMIVDQGHTIIWHAFDDAEPGKELAGDVNIELWKEGVGWLLDIATEPVAAHGYGWTPADDGLVHNVLDRYRIKIISVANGAILDQSREPFSIVSQGKGSDFFVDDDSNVNDQYTPGAVGDNRNTGQTAGDPKANLLPILRSYALGPGDTVKIDTGDYIHVRNVILSGDVGVGDDEGMRITGPTDPAKIAAIDRGNPYANMTNIELYDADYVTLAHLTLTGGNRGLWVHNSSTNFDGRHLTLSDNTLDGLLVETDAEDTTLDYISAYDNDRYGIYVMTPIDSLSNSLVHDNANYGIYLTGQDGVVIESSEIYNNSTGIYISNNLTNWATIGNEDLALGLGNKIYDNADTGVHAMHKTLVVGNTIYGHNGPNDKGVYARYGAEVRHNVVYDNSFGIYLHDSSKAVGNRVYLSNTEGIRLSGHSSEAHENTVYNNPIGIRSQGHSNTVVANNLVYNTSGQGVLVSGGSSPDIVSNTVYLDSGEALRVQSSVLNITIRNNILWVDDGYDLFVDSTSQVGFDSDFNILQTTGTGKTGSWQGVDRPTMLAWQNAAFTDSNSFAQDPQFVDQDGADGVLGYNTLVDDGRDDDFHLKSSVERMTGSLTPVRDAATGLPVWLASVPAVDATQSPGIDRGDADSDFLNELPENGGYINIGAYGNTVHASKSPVEYVLVTLPDGGEVWPADQTFPIRWRTEPVIVPGTAADYRTRVLADSPVGYWRLGEAVLPVAYDETAGAHHGAYTGGPLLSQVGVFPTDDSVYFDGVSSRVEIPDAAALNPAQITVEAWVNPTADISNYAGILSKTTGTSWDDGFGLMHYSGQNVRFFVNHFNTNYVTTQLIPGVWTHLVGTYDGSEIRLYANGVLVDSMDFSDPINHSSADLAIGSDTAGDTYNWKGQLDEAALYGAALEADDVLAHYNLGPNGRGNVDIELFKGGVFDSLLVDDFPNFGEYRWAIPAPTVPGLDYKVQVARSENAALFDESNFDFEITEPINVYYVNDGSLVDDEYAAAVGNDANDGLTPATPKASIRAVLEAYDLDAGDTILVDTGSYTLSVNIEITNQDSGAEIRGPILPGHQALIDRANTSAGQCAFELINADGITLDHLAITGGNYGVYASGSSDSDNVTISNSEIFENQNEGVYTLATNDDLVLTGNELRRNYEGADVGGQRPTITDNTIHDNTTYGLNLVGHGGNVSGNTVYGNDNGIYLSGTGDWTTVSSNTVFDNRHVGIEARYNVTLADNVVYGHTESSQGILVRWGAKALRNTVHHNFMGIVMNYGGVAVDNRVFDNSDIGIRTDYDSPVRGNQVYDNRVGIQAQGQFTSELVNNIVYDNTDHGILLNGVNSAWVHNNSVYQPSGDAVHVQTSSKFVDIRNNILHVTNGSDIFVDASSQNNFSSDYNILFFDGAGTLANWDGFIFTDRADWFYELGFDGNSRTTDPLLTDIDGADDILGFSTAPLGAAMIIDDGDVGFALVEGVWAPGSLSGGYNGDYLEITGGDGLATWTFAGLTPGATYHVATTWRNRSGNTSQGRYEVYDDGELVSMVERNQYYAPDDFSDGGVDWETEGYFVATAATMEIRLTNDLASSRLVADAVRIQEIEGDGGLDDDFRLQAGSPGIDGGDVLSYYLSEPEPSGDRVNVGAYGNTAEAATSAAQIVQVLDPNGLEKFEVGQNVDIKWRSAGLTLQRTAALINSGDAGTVDNWLHDRYYTGSSTYGTLNQTIDLAGVADPPPEALYQSYRYINGVGAKLVYELPVPDGDYTLRLHFAEPSSWIGVGTRRFDINLQGVQVVDDFDIMAEAGARYKAHTRSFAVTAALGTGILLELINETTNGAVISGIELTALNAGGVAAPTVDLKLSTDDGVSYPAVNDIAAGLTMDRFGRGSHPWVAAPETGSNLARVKVLANDGASPWDASDESFLIANDGADYYVNIPLDANLLDNEYTGAAGSNLNSGKTFDMPMASLRALLSAYDLDPGDTVHVDTGDYLLLANVVMSAQDAGVTVLGPVAHRAVLDRANVSIGSYAFEFVDADGVTLDHLGISGGYYGVYVGASSDSSDITISNSEVFDNYHTGVYVHNSNDNATIDANTVYRNDTYGVYVYGNAATVSGNTVSGSDTGIYSNGTGSLTTVSGNTVFDNFTRGVHGAFNTLVTGNEVYGHDGSNDWGIYVLHAGAAAEGNIVHHNYNGIYANHGADAIGNRVYANLNVGVWINYASNADGNIVYDNSVGISANGQSTGVVRNNLIYANGNQGVVLAGADGTKVVNNTIFQPVGDAIRLQNSSYDVDVRNNILWVQDGYDIFVTADSQSGFTSNYNILHTTLLGKMVSWGGAEFLDRQYWYYALNNDADSLTDDPQFVNSDGPDAILGFSAATMAPAAIIDDGDAGFTLNGAGWTAEAGGLNGDFRKAPGSLDPEDNTAEWTFTGLTAGATYNVAATWANHSSYSYGTYYEVYDGDKLVRAPKVDQRYAPDDFSDAGANWEELGVVVLTGTTLTVKLSNWTDPARPVVADAIRIQQIEGDRGADDDFHLQSGSPGVDMGDPFEYYLTEPGPNGGRANAGAFGNTSEATVSPTQIVQVLDPNGYEKFEVGDTVEINWRTSGATLNHTDALINSGNQGTVDNWLYDSYYTGSSSYSSFSGAVDLSGVADPAPEDVYRSYRYINGVGEKLVYELPVRDGDYAIRLHFAEPTSWIGVGGRLFDINLQGVLEANDYDILQDAGARYKAVTQDFAVTAVGGAGILLELINEAAYGAVISGIELTSVNPGGATGPTVDLELSTDNGGAYAPIPGASGLTMDRFGQGSFAWVAGPETIGNEALIKAKLNPEDSSNAAFLITNDGPDYYVSATGDNANSGKTRSEPMAGINAVLLAYDLDPGDTIHVEAGVYTLLTNILLLAEDSGVTISGPVNPAVQAVQDRNNTLGGNYGFELVNADDVTIEYLHITGGQYGVYAGSGSDSDDLTIRNCEVYGNSYSGVYLYTTNDTLVLNDNILRNNDDGARAYGANSILTDNQVYDNSTYGLYSYAYGATITGNEVHDNSTGMYVYSSGAQSTVSGNTVFDNTYKGIYASSGVLVSNNRVYGQNGANGVGIDLTGGARAFQNYSYLNYDGIKAVTGATVEANRVFENDHYGIWANHNSPVIRNRVYDNSVGVFGASSFYDRIENNLIYDNSDQGVILSGASSGANPYYVVNNTIYQLVGDAIRLQSSTNHSRIYNNILWVEAGYDIFVDASSQNDFISNYNLLYTGVDINARTGFWGSEQDLLGDWRGATLQDAESIDPNPQFVDIDGADNVLGYTTDGGGYDGGADDNFGLSGGSPAIDRANAWKAPLTDIDGFIRVDDPGTPNLGYDYAENDLGSSLMPSGGVAQPWNDYDGYWTLNFPVGFTFPFIDAEYSSVYVTSNGLLQFDTISYAYDGTNTPEEFITRRLIAPLWDNLRTNGVGDGIFVDTSILNQVTIRWDATNEADSSDVNMAVTLYDTGDIRFHYGGGNTALTPTIGISSGDGVHYMMGAHDGAAVLTDANSIEFSVFGGIVDMGAHEFTGSSLDATPPIVTSTDPTQTHDSLTQATFGDFDVSFSEPLDVTEANAPANYELVSPGLDLDYGTPGDNVVYTLLPTYSPGSLNVTIDILGVSALPTGEYRLKIFGDTSIRDTAGNRLDGDEDTFEGGDYVRFIDVDNTPPTVSAFEVNDGLPQRSRIDSLAITFSEDVSASLNAADLSLWNITEAQMFYLGGVAMVYNPGTNTATWDTSAGVSPTALLDGNYVATLSAAGVSDAVGLPLDGDGNGAGGDDFAFEFFVLTGDTNGDRAVDDLDYDALVSQFGMSGSGLAADLDGSGRVNLFDFAIMRGAFGNTLAPPPPPAPVLETPAVPVTEPQAEDEPVAEAPVTASVDLLSGVLSTDGYVSASRRASVGLAAEPVHRAATAGYDLRPLSDDPSSERTGDLLADILAESPLAVLP
ncbi:MAG: right-handed parallel beta-helix repeat-containing protein [Phycisphaerae bacterium]|jgi:parallel beta-helix repeat protein|nr:right-handed parallel beta-helix repeat-containing protein [Phycisphaerae bacterium]